MQPLGEGARQRRRMDGRESSSLALKIPPLRGIHSLPFGLPPFGLSSGATLARAPSVVCGDTSPMDGGCWKTPV